MALAGFTRQQTFPPTHLKRRHTGLRRAKKQKKRTLVYSERSNAVVIYAPAACNATPTQRIARWMGRRARGAQRRRA